MRKLVSLLGICLAASVALVAAPVSAASTPDIGFKVPAHAHANKPTTVHWHASGVGSKTVVLQGYSSAKGWQKVGKKLHGTEGKKTIPALPIGIFDFRIAVFDHSGKLIAAKGHKLHVFGKVSWRTLFQTPKNDAGRYGSFHYVYSFFSNAVNYTALKVSHNPCTSIHISYIPGTENPNESVGGVGTVMIGRHGRSSVTSQAAAQHKATSHATLPLGKSWSINLSEDGTGSRLYTWYFNGSGICDQKHITSFAYNQN